MDTVDRKILNIIQKSFPVEAEPFRTIGALVGIAPEEALDRVRKLRQSGLIRRIGAVFDPKQLGYVSTLCAARVPKERFREFVACVNGYAGVTHNYRRSHAYNVWFTIIAAGEDELDRILAEIKESTGVSDLISLRAVRTYKIDARFDL
jgi:DNA-binding Lrp family transcriptional regulator